MSMGEKILNMRKARGWSQEELAERVGVTRQAVSRWEADSAKPDADKLLVLSNVLSVTADYLLRDELEAPVLSVENGSIKLPGKLQIGLIVLAAFLALGSVMYIFRRPRDVQNIIDENGFVVVDQIGKQILIEIPKTEIPEGAWNGETVCFDSGVITVWGNETTKLYLKEIRTIGNHPGISDDQIVFTIDFLHDLPGEGSAILPCYIESHAASLVKYSIFLPEYSKYDKWTESFLGVSYPGITLLSFGPGYQFEVAVMRDACIAQEESISFYICGFNEVYYKRGNG